MALIRNV